QRILVTITNSFSSKRLSKNIRALFSSKKGDFRVQGSASLKLPDDIRKEAIALSFDEKGSFSLK
ncbi:MAG TPA: hypothetical protein DCG47_04845, partial [Spirochaetaceae bacterium]|nr:hypothetical protein [Spirochaetaceae bacterium]